MNRTFEYVVDGILLTLVSTFGLIGTLLAIRVLVKPSLRNSFSTLLVGLATCDAHFLFFAILILGLPKAWPWYKNDVSVHLVPICYGLIGVARMGSVYLTMSVTLERYFAIVRPLSHFGMKKFLLPGSILFAAIYNIPKFFELERDVFELDKSTMVVATDLRENPVYKSYMFWSKVIVLEAIPYMTIIILNALIIKQILKSYQFRKSFQKPLDEDQPFTEIPMLEVNKETEALNMDTNVDDCEAQRGFDPQRDKDDSFSSGSLHSDNRGHHIGLENDIEISKCPVEQIDLATNLNDSDSNGRWKQFVSFSSNLSLLSRFSFRSASVRETDRGHLRPQTSVTSRQKQLDQEISLGLTLIGISLLFITCQSVKIIPDLYEITCEVKEWGENHSCLSTPFIETIISISNLLTCINSSANFLIYMLRGKKFRDAFLDTYTKPKWCRTVRSSGRRGDQNNSVNTKSFTKSVMNQPGNPRLNLSPSTL